MSIKEFVLKVNNRVVVTNCGGQQNLRVASGRGQDYFQTWGMGKPGFRILRVVRSGMNPSTRWTAEHHRHWNAPAVITFRSIVDYLIESACDKVNELKFDYR